MMSRQAGLVTAAWIVRPATMVRSTLPCTGRPSKGELRHFE
jgi:hypothetical protein